MKVGKMAAFLVGGGIIFVEVANEQGWIKIDCMSANDTAVLVICLIFFFINLGNKLSNEIDKAAEKVEEVTANEGPRMLDRVNIAIKVINKFTNTTVFLIYRLNNYA